MTARTYLRRSVAALAVAGVAAGVTALAAGTASADNGYGPSVFPCTSNQFTSKVVYGGAGAGNRNAAIQFTANPGERCLLPGKLDVGLVGAHDVLVDNQAPADAPPVALVDGSSAYVPLHWTAIGSDAEQQTPNGITFSAPSDSNAHGDHIDPNVTLDWKLGPVDAGPVSHSVDVGALTPGTAPTV
ncbi:DUF4232 domain-containing protein [Amycolatopsis sp. NPDC059027]|uniref:DUF4232 domain-containing protein n=1 Tax=unclassified Amycolatopsis TaxID=2618356 RepID=UPI00366FEA7A